MPLGRLRFFLYRLAFQRVNSRQRMDQGFLHYKLRKALEFSFRKPCPMLASWQVHTFVVPRDLVEDLPIIGPTSSFSLLPFNLVGRRPNKTVRVIFRKEAIQAVPPGYLLEVSAAYLVRHDHYSVAGVQRCETFMDSEKFLVSCVSFGCP